MCSSYGTDSTYIRSFSVAQTLTGVGNSVQRISNTCVLGTHQYSWKGEQCVCSSRSTWEDITISLGRPLSRSGVGFALDSHSATKVDRRTLFYEDGWRRLSLFPVSGVRKGRGFRFSRKKVGEVERVAAPMSEILVETFRRTAGLRSGQITLS